MVETEVQKLIDIVHSLGRTKTAIEEIRGLEMYQNMEPEYYNEEAGAAPSYYLMYKDLHAVERVLVNRYGNNLCHILHEMHTYITNTVQEFLFENIDALSSLYRQINHVIEMELLVPAEQYVFLGSKYTNINYIQSAPGILTGFKTMVDWVYNQIRLGIEPERRKAYDKDYKV